MWHSPPWRVETSIQDLKMYQECYRIVAAGFVWPSRSEGWKSIGSGSYEGGLLGTCVTEEPHILLSNLLSSLSRKINQKKWLFCTENCCTRWWKFELHKIRVIFFSITQLLSHTSELLNFSKIHFSKTPTEGDSKNIISRARTCGRSHVNSIFLLVKLETLPCWMFFVLVWIHLEAYSHRKSASCSTQFILSANPFLLCFH